MSEERLAAARKALQGSRVINRELLVEYGRALNEELDRRQELVREAQVEHALVIKNLHAAYEGVVHLLQFLPHAIATQELGDEDVKRVAIFLAAHLCSGCMDTLLPHRPACGNQNPAKPRPPWPYKRLQELTAPNG